jgi:hypothetical protein
VGSWFDQDLCVHEKVSLWTSVVAGLTFAVLSHPQTALLQKLLQHKWQFLQRVINGIRESFNPIEEAISDLFLPVLF